MTGVGPDPFALAQAWLILKPIETFKKDHAGSRGPLNARQTEVEREDWKTSHDIKGNSKEENELELLALLIQEYERQTVPPVKADPAESIFFRRDQMQLSRKDLIPYLGSISKVSEVLSRKRK